MYKNTITITYGDQAENHVGMQKIGKLALNGLSYNDLVNAKEKFEKIGCKCEHINLHDMINKKDTIDSKHVDKASILIIRNGINKLLGDKMDKKMYIEQNKLDTDKKAFMYGRVVNKKARHNLCFGNIGQEPDYINKKGRIIPWDDVPITNNIRKIFPTYFGEITKNITAEGNYYYDVKKCYIGFHGDTERKIVIAVRLGESMPLYYQWYNNNKPIGDKLECIINHGDIYAMDEKATGNDWKKRKIYTLRHAAGLEKNIKIKKIN